MGEWLDLIGSIFYSPSCYRRHRGSAKEEEVIEEEITEEKSEVIEEAKPAEETKPTVSNVDDDEDEVFDD